MEHWLDEDFVKNALNVVSSQAVVEEFPLNFCLGHHILCYMAFPRSNLFRDRGSTGPLTFALVLQKLISSVPGC